MYRMYLDEVGAEDLGAIEREEHRFLSLTGLIFSLDHVRDYLVPAIDDLKRSCFTYDPDSTICLHRYDIVHKRGIFHQLNDANLQQRFNDKVLQIVSKADYAVITVLVDKLEMTRQRHWKNQHPYHYLMEIIVEKFTLFLDACGQTGDIMPEARQGKKDKALQDAFGEVRVNGTRYVSPDLICSRLRAESLKFRTKKDNIAGLQLCDLIAHPSHLDVRLQNGQDISLGLFARAVLKILHEQKYNRSKTGEVRGFGVKYLP